MPRRPRVPGARRASARGRGRVPRARRPRRSGIGYSRTTRMPAATPTSAGTAAISGSTPEPSVAALTAARPRSRSSSAPPIAAATMSASNISRRALTPATTRSWVSRAGPVPRATRRTVARTAATVDPDDDRHGRPRSSASRPAGTSAIAPSAATAPAGSAIRSPSASTGPTTCAPDAPRDRASDIVARRRRAASTAIRPSVPIATSDRPQRHDRDERGRRRPPRPVALEDRQHAGPQRRRRSSRVMFARRVQDLEPPEAGDRCGRGSGRAAASGSRNERHV